jgi:secreted Zn-dependent insulinase-like peptidase
MADFMQEPLLNSDSEVSAVHAEHMKNIPSPGRRMNQVSTYAFDPKGIGRFSTGEG